MIIFDLDGTLADCEHRRHYVQGKKQNWKAFHEECIYDSPILPVIKVLDNFIVLDCEIQIWSGRCESVRSQTEEWLAMHVIENDKYPIKLKMRPVRDYTPDDQLKEQWLDEALSQGKEVACVFDDRPKVVRMWKRRGIFVFNCYQDEKEF